MLHAEGGLALPARRAWEWLQRFRHPDEWLLVHLRSAGLLREGSLRWVPRERLLTESRSRGWSKTTDLSALAMSMMLSELPPRSRLYGLAADRDQGALLVDAACVHHTRAGRGVDDLERALRAPAVVDREASGRGPDLVAGELQRPRDMRRELGMIEQVFEDLAAHDERLAVDAGRERRVRFPARADLYLS